jgi:hypothetical protein
MTKALANASDVNSAWLALQSKISRQALLLLPVLYTIASVTPSSHTIMLHHYTLRVHRNIYWQLICNLLSCCLQLSLLLLTLMQVGRILSQGSDDGRVSFQQQAALLAAARQQVGCMLWVTENPMTGRCHNVIT